MLLCRKTEMDKPGISSERQSSLKSPRHRKRDYLISEHVDAQRVI